MKKPVKFLLIGLLVLALVGLLIYWAFYSIGRLSGQELLLSSTSPEGSYTVSVYRNSGGATTGYAVLGVVRNNHTGRERNFYWQADRETAELEWLDEQTVKIGGVTLDVTHDTYDYRRT